MTSYAYARVSTDTQDLALQRDALEKAGIPPTRTFEDDGISGAKPLPDRPGGRAVLAALQPGDELVFYSLSRLGRSAGEVLRLLESLAARGVTVRSLTEGLDTRSPAGRAMVGMLAVFAQWEREVLAERVRDGIAAAQARGVPFGRPGTVDSETAARLRAEVAAGASVSEAARRVGVSDSAARRALRKSAKSA